MLTRRRLLVGGAASAAYALLARRSYGQSAPTDPVAPDRLIYGGTWEGLVGVPGGIPLRNQSSDIYTTIQPYTGTPATINNAIAACPANKVVQLGPGVFNLSASGSGDGAIMLRANNVTLRGSVDGNNVPTTIINFTGSNNTIQISDRGWDINNPGLWTKLMIGGGAVRGSSTITLTAAPTGLSVGMLMFILGNPTTLPDATIRGGGWSRWFAGVSDQLAGNPFCQTVKVTAVSGNNVSFSSPINADYLGAASPFVVYRSSPSGTTTVLSGIENLDLQCGTAGNPGTAVAQSNYVSMQGADSCWVKNVKAYWGAGDARMIYPYLCYRCEIRHCEIHHTQGISSNCYCILPLHCSGLLIEDNYFHDVPNVMPMMGLHGSAFAYNYITDEPYASPNWLSQVVFFHGSHCHYNLFEGNWGCTHYNDATESGQFSHSRNNVFFRERLRGWDANGPKTANCQALTFEAHHDNVVVAGCVLGEPGFHTTYLGGTPAGGGDNAIIDADAATKATWQRVANYNTVNAAIPAAEAVGGGQSLVTSYLHRTKPAWFGALPWPWCDPSNFAQSNNPNSFPAGYRAINGKDPVAGAAPTAPTNVRIVP